MTLMRVPNQKSGHKKHFQLPPSSKMMVRSPVLLSNCTDYCITHFIQSFPLKRQYRFCFQRFSVNAFTLYTHIILLRHSPDRASKIETLSLFQTYKRLSNLMSGHLSRQSAEGLIVFAKDNSLLQSTA
jgi:hypothetical protein